MAKINPRSGKSRFFPKNGLYFLTTGVSYVTVDALDAALTADRKGNGAGE
ncbi:MAG: hypothetical protein MR051_01700 [Lentisphaeria bacterium]|nr:hypothetical protein [Lentisphaeria bacterium]